MRARPQTGCSRRARCTPELDSQPKTLDPDARACAAADRPFTESEVRFLRYIREWGKKVVFVLNKVDILASDSEVDEARLTLVPRALKPNQV